MSRLLPRVMVAPNRRSQIPPLANGDHLNRLEFERRYHAMPEGTRAELIDGIVYIAPPVSHDQHANPHFDLITALGVYRAATPGVTGGDNATIRLDLDNLPQPDIYLMVNPAHGGQAKVDEDGYVEGAPELVAEIAATSANYDLHQKLEVYRRNGIKEYIVWRTLDRQLDYFILSNDEYQPLPHMGNGLIHSKIFPGFWLDPAALIAGNLAVVLQKLQTGLSSPEHETFVTALKQRTTPAA